MMAGLTHFGEAADPSQVNGIMHVDPVMPVSAHPPVNPGSALPGTDEQGWMDSHAHRFSEDPATSGPLLGFDDTAALEHDIYDAGGPGGFHSAGMGTQVASPALMPSSGMPAALSGMVGATLDMGPGVGLPGQLPRMGLGPEPRHDPWASAGLNDILHGDPAFMSSVLPDGGASSDGEHRSRKPAMMGSRMPQHHQGSNPKSSKVSKRKADHTFPGPYMRGSGSGGFAGGLGGDLSDGARPYPEFKIGDRVVVRGNKRTPPKLVGMDAVVLSQCGNGWYEVRITVNGERHRLQYRSIQSVADAAASGWAAGGVGGMFEGEEDVGLLDDMDLPLEQLEMMADDGSGMAGAGQHPGRPQGNGHGHPPRPRDRDRERDRQRDRSGNGAYRRYPGSQGEDENLYKKTYQGAPRRRGDRDHAYSTRAPPPPAGGGADAGAPPTAAPPPAEFKALRKELLQLEDRIPWSAVRKDWRTKRSVWRKAVKAAGDTPEVAHRLTELRGALVFSSEGPSESWSAGVAAVVAGQGTMQPLLDLWAVLRSDVHKWLQKRAAMVAAQPAAADLTPEETAAGAARAVSAMKEAAALGEEHLMAVPLEILLGNNPESLQAVRQALEHEKRVVATRLAALDRGGAEEDGDEGGAVKLENGEGEAGGAAGAEAGAGAGAGAATGAAAGAGAGAGAGAVVDSDDEGSAVTDMGEDDD